MLTYSDVLHHMVPLVDEMNHDLREWPGPQIAIVARLLRPMSDSEVGIVALAIPGPDGRKRAEAHCHLFDPVTIPQLGRSLRDCQQKLLLQLVDWKIQSFQASSSP